MFLVYTKAQIFAAIWQLFLHILDLYEWIYSQSSHQQKLDVASEADPANTRHVWETRCCWLGCISIRPWVTEGPLS